MIEPLKARLDGFQDSKKTALSMESPTGKRNSVNVLHIIVRHKNNPNPKYPNKWLDEWRIKSIVTYAEIADLCRPLAGADTPVRIHRTAYRHSPPVVCCEARVSAVQPSGTLYTVEFDDCRPLELPTPIRPDGYKSFYYAECPDSEQIPGGNSQGNSVGAEEDLDHITSAQATPIQNESLNPQSGEGNQVGDVNSSVALTSDSSTPDSQRSGHLELLQRGIDTWNFARRSKPDVQPKLNGADLRPVLKGRHMQAINLSRADLCQANLSGLVLRNPSFVRASLRSANLEGSNWAGANSNGPESPQIRLAEGYYANFTGAILNESDLSGASLEKACLHGADFRQANLKSADFSNSMLRGLRFDGADLRCVKFLGADLTDAILDGADLRGADLSTTVVSRKQLDKAKIDATTRLPVDWDF